MSDKVSLDEQRRELELRRAGSPTVNFCEKHGEHASLICVPCYALQQERIERESGDLRYANTGEAIRARVVAHRAVTNGHGAL